MSSLRSELCKSKQYRFEVRRGERIVEGKAYWPAHVHLHMSRAEAFTLVRAVLNLLESGHQVEVTLPGRLEARKDDED